MGFVKVGRAQVGWKPGTNGDIVKLMLSRRTALLAPLAAPLGRACSARLDAAPGKMVLSIHMTTSQGAGYQKALEGWAKAGIKYVEITDRGLDDFLKTNDIAAAKRVITDLGLTLVSCASVLQDFWNQNPGFATQLETWKKRCEQFATLGSPRIYCPSTTSRESHGGRLQDHAGRHSPGRRRGQGVQPHRDDRVRAQFDADRHADHFAQADSRGRASQRASDAGLLSLLVGLEQVRGSRPAEAGRAGARAFPGHAGYSQASCSRRPRG